MKYVILSSLKHVGKIQEDLMLQEKLCAENDCEILAWENVTETDIKNKDVFIVRSVWGYHNNYVNFIKLLEKINSYGKTIINGIDNIKENISKSLQYKYCMEQGLKIIPSYFIKNNSTNNEELKHNIMSSLKVNTNSEIVVKPIISASGDGTVKIKVSEFNISDYGDYLSDNFQGLVIQPFVSSIKKGEYSAIVIKDELQYVALRFPGVIAQEKSVTLLNDIPQKLLKSINSAIKILKNKKTCYYRLDFFKFSDDYYINEIEMTDPDLFTRKIDKSLASDTISNFANTIINKTYGD